MRYIISEIHVANVLTEGVYCCFTRTTLFTTMFIVVLQELHCLPNCLHVGFNRVIGFYHFTRFPCSILASF